MKLYFLRACPVWTTAIPAATVEEMPNWLAKKLIAGGVAIAEATHQERIAARAMRKAEEKAKKNVPVPEQAPDESVMVGAVLPEKKSKKGGKN